MKVFQNWLPMVKLAAPACLMVEVKCIRFEILTLLAGLNGTAELCAQTLLVTLCEYIFKVPFALGITTSAQIADLLGRGSAYEAKEVAKLFLFLAGGIGSLTVLFALSFRNQILYLLTSDEDVATLMLSTVLLVVIFTLIDAIAGVLSGIIRGIGKQYISAMIQTVG